ncbi:ovule receptor-like kinase 28, partial [Genlisea aurea]
AFAAVSVLLIGVFSAAGATTDPTDASTLNALYASLNSPQQLTNWKSTGGDPCGESWRGVTCSGSRVTQIVISGLGLTGNMGYQLLSLTAVTTFDISNNNLGNQIPYQLPPNVQTLNLAGCNFNNGLPYSISYMNSLGYLNVSHNQLQGQVNVQFGSLTALSTLDLSFNALSDGLPQSFASLTSMKNMYLQNNQFTGTIDVLSNLPLVNLNVENNRFTGWIPNQLTNINSLQTSGNQFNTGPAPPPPPGTPPFIQGSSPNIGTTASPSSGRSSSGSKSGVGGGAVAGIVISVLVVTAVLLALFILKRRSRKASSDVEKHSTQPFVQTREAQQDYKPVETSSTVINKAFETPPAVVNLRPPPPFERHKSFDDNDDKSAKPVVVTPKKVEPPPVSAKLFSVADLQVATDSFSVENLVGEGSIGRVYRAETDDGRVLAVKKINSPAVSDSERFLEVVSEISRLHHGNVSELVGYCCEHGQCLLVYEFQKNGSLYDHLHLGGDENGKGLAWNSRVRIALGSARALEYLHEVCSPSVIHKNLKSANILLDDELNPRLSDCGLARLISEPADQGSGYVAPEVAMSGQYTVKSDVYSFGVVMLELISGRKPFDSSKPRSEQSLVRWATPQLHDIDALSKMVDPSLKGLYPAKSLSQFADIIALCVQAEPEFRPSMSEVVEAIVRLVQRANMSRRTFGNEGSNRSAGSSDGNE